MRNFPDKTCTENQNTHFLFNNFLSKTVPFMRRGKIYRSQTIWRTCNAFWIPKATNRHSKNVIFIAFPLQQWLHEYTSYYTAHTLPVLLYNTVMAHMNMCVCVYKFCQEG